MYDGIKLFLEWVGYFFIAYLIGYSTFLFLSVVVGSLELYKHRRQEMLKSILPSDYYLPISIIVPAYNEEVTVADTVRSLLTLDNSAYRFPAAVPVDASQETLEAKARDMVDFTFRQLMMQAGRDSVADAGFHCNVCIVEDGMSLLIYVLYD